MAWSYLLVVVVVTAVGIAVLLLRQRRPTSVRSGITNFERARRAASPESSHHLARTDADRARRRDQRPRTRVKRAG